MAKKQQVVIVTGMSGAGKSTALDAFEDMGFEAIDNVPLPLIQPLVGFEQSSGTIPIVIGVDSRTRQFSPQRFSESIALLKRNPDVEVTVLFFECSNDTLTRRYAETRRKHPLAEDRPASDGIVRERELLAGVRIEADSIFDTTTLSGHETRLRLAKRFENSETSSLRVTVMSFGFARGVPRDADLMFDVRFLRNPHYVPELKPKTGKNTEVATYVQADEQFTGFTKRLDDLVGFLIERYKADDRSYLTIAFGCTGGKHRSVMLAERLAKQLANAAVQVNIDHRDLPEDHGN